MKMRALAVVSSLSWATLVSLPSWAHHSFAAYDQNVTKAATGTLKELEWSAPHSAITIAYTDETGKTQEVSLTTGAPNTIFKQGFKQKDFRVGSKVKITWHPNRNGLSGGELVELTLDDGRVLVGAFGAFRSPATPAGTTAPPGSQPNPK